MNREGQAAIDALFEKLFGAYQRPIYNYLYRLLGDGGRAEESAQDVFTRAYRSLGRLPEDANHRAWLYRIATNAAYDLLRRRRLIKWVPLMERDLKPEGRAQNIADTLGTTDAVQRALGEIPPKYRAPLILYTVQGYSVGEIGEMMAISQGAVKTRLYRAREMFRKVYRGEIGDAL